LPSFLSSFLSFAVFAGQGSAPSILWLANSPSEPAKGRLLAELAQEQGIKLSLQYISGDDPELIREKILQQDLILVDYVYPNQYMEILTAWQDVLKQHPGKVFPGLFYDKRELHPGLTPEQSKILFQYYNNGGKENYRRMFTYIRRELFGEKGIEVKPPIIFPETGIYHPDAPQLVFKNLDEYLAWKKPSPQQPRVGIGFHRLRLSSEMMLPIVDLIHRLEKEGIVPVAYFHPTDKSSRDVMYRTISHDGKNKRIQKKAGKEKDEVSQKEVSSDAVSSASPPKKKTVKDDGRVPGLDLIVTFRGVMNSPKLRHRELDAMNIPAISALTYRNGTAEEWYEDEGGWPFYAMGPFYINAELAGYIDAIVVAAIRKSDEQHVSIPEQMDALVERIKNYLALKRKPNKDKKIAFVVWNSPEGEENFGASYLNVPESLEDIFDAMRKAGYTLPPIGHMEIIEKLKKLIKPYYRTSDDKMLRSLLKEGLAEKLPLEEYKEWLSSFPEKIRKDMDKTWGGPEDTYLTLTEGNRKYFIIPRLKLGNIYLFPQPLRGARRSEEKDILHDKKRPVHHAYRAVYFQFAHRDKVDAFVHLGTHGTQEWLSGKERAQWVYDDTWSTIGNVPVVYPYNVANTGEALIARRRGRATVISHNAPPFAPAGLYGDLIKLHELLSRDQEMEEGRVKESNKKAIIKLVQELGFDKDMGISREEMESDDSKFIEKLHNYVDDIAGTAQPLGMHTFGSTAEPDHILLTILQILGPDYLEKAEGEKAGEVFARPYEEQTQSKSFLALKEAILENKPIETFPTELRSYLEEAKRHFENFMQEQEIENLLDALSLGFVPTGTGNDPLRNPDAVPTGKNVYAFDPKKIPTKAAWEAGIELAKSLIDGYKEKHGVYPDKLAFSMWSTETFKHFGVIEAEILYVLGVRPIWNERDQVTGVEIIPLEELQRPRIDAVLSLTGLYRDNLPEVMALLQGAINKVAALKEPDNFVRKHTLITKEKLLAKGLTEEEAERYAKIRLFGAESGVYGTNLPEATLASDIWEDDEPLAKMYLSRMGYMFGNEAGTHSKKLKDIDLFAENLSGTKAAVLSRSTNNHGILSLDHPFEYLGGIGMAVRYLDGKTPELYIADLRNTRNFRNETVADFLAKELRTRYYHPRWIKEMMKENYSGANEILDIINNFWGWNVMDETSVRPDQWQELFEIYTQDKLDLGVDEWFKKVHPSALAQIAERMLEAIRKGYWEASEETVKALVETYLSVLKEHDVFTSNEKFKEFLEQKTKGFGLSMPKPATPNESKVNPAQESAVEQVEGVRLEEQIHQEKEEAIYKKLYLIAIFFLLFIAGFILEQMRNHREVM